MRDIDIEVATRNFDAETSRREFSMRIGGFPTPEIIEFVQSRENLRQQLIEEHCGPQCAD